jgi:hypothetical protein
MSNKNVRVKMKIKYVLCVLLLILLSVNAFPQEEAAKADSSESGWNWHEWEKFHHDMDFLKNGFKGSPTIVLKYGLSGMSLNNFRGSFADPNLLEIKLGYTDEKSYKHNENLVDYDFKYLYLSNISTDIGNVNVVSPELKNSSWRFGFGKATGYGYKIGKSAVIPYYSYDLSWTKLDLENQVIPANDKALLDNFDGTFRFGTNTEGGIKFKVIPMLTFDASYERAIIFPRHLFWKWAGSVAIESIGQFLVDDFVGEIMHSSPYAGPVMSFILKNALSYGIYELRQDKMNWPFKSAAPLAYDQFKFGFTVNF